MQSSKHTSDDKSGHEMVADNRQDMPAASGPVTDLWASTATAAADHDDPWGFGSFDATPTLSRKDHSMTTANTSSKTELGLSSMGYQNQDDDDPWADASLAAVAILTTSPDLNLKDDTGHSTRTSSFSKHSNTSRNSLSGTGATITPLPRHQSSSAILGIHPPTPTLMEFMDILNKYESGQDVDLAAMTHPRHIELIGVTDPSNNHDSADITDHLDINASLSSTDMHTHGLYSRQSESDLSSSMSEDPTRSNSIDTRGSIGDGTCTLSVPQPDIPHRNQGSRGSRVASSSPKNTFHPNTFLKPDDERGITSSKSQTISNIQSVFTDTQKIAYVGLCYLCISFFRKSRLANFKKAAAAYDVWSDQFMEKLYVYLDLLPEERMMIKNLAEHGLLPSDLSTGLLNDAKKALAELEKQQQEEQQAEQHALDSGLQPSLSKSSVAVSNKSQSVSSNDNSPSDVRYTILSHLFILSIADGRYDARARCILRKIAHDMEIPMLDLAKLENVIADQLRIYEDHEVVKPDEEVVDQRNKVDGRNRWLLAGIATLAGGAVIGVTAGLAAPFIGAGIGAALTTFGITGATGLSTFMASTGGLAIITAGGVLSGGGMSGVKMMRRTRGIEEFEFLGLEDALNIINKNREQRKADRRKRRGHESRVKPGEKQPQESDAAAKDGASVTSSSKESPLMSSSKLPSISTRPGSFSFGDARLANNPKADVLWEISSVADSHVGEDTQTKRALNVDEISTGDQDVNTGNDEPAQMGIVNQKGNKSRQTNVLITVAGWISNGADDHTFPFSTLEPGHNGDQYTLIWETKALQELGSALRILLSEVTSFILQQGIQATLLPVLMAGLTGPLWMIKLTYLVDNPWGNALTKAEKAGRVLADTLMGQVQGNRPVTLVGFSLGARVIYFCLLELAAHGAHGIIEDVYMFGTPVIGSRKAWEKISSIVAGKVVNGYTQNDMLLGVLYRASLAAWSEVAGLRPVNDVPGIENMDLSDTVKGHLDYRSQLPIILKSCGFSINAEKFQDQDTEEEEERLEIEQERLEAKEQREREREERNQKRLDEALQRTKERQIEIERKRKEKEDAAIAAAILAARKKAEAAMATTPTSSSSTGWFGPRKPSTAVKASVNASKSSAAHLAPVAQDQIVADELRQMSELEDMMQVYWEPREIQSTLPPLVIAPNPDSLTAISASSSQPPSRVASEIIHHDMTKDSANLSDAVNQNQCATSHSVDESITSEDALQLDMLHQQMNDLDGI
ncbi:hypothetical protein RTP6_006015 [Batrachochytrium dendrobatidis]